MLTHGMVGVGHRGLKRIAEHRLSFCELDAVVFSVRRRLARVPFELHGPSVGLFAAIRSFWLLSGLTDWRSAAAASAEARQLFQHCAAAAGSNALLGGRNSRRVKA